MLIFPYDYVFTILFSFVLKNGEQMKQDKFDLFLRRKQNSDNFFIVCVHALM